MTDATLFTVGHGTRSLDELAATLSSAGVSVLVDVRRFPGSRRHPQFSRASLERELPRREIAYEWQGEALGGRRSTPGGPAASRHPAWRVAGFRAYAEHMDTEEFRGALRALEQRVRSGTRVAVMCAETLWWRCHRRLIADAAACRGLAVTHLMGPREAEPHRPHPAMRRGEDGWPVYDVGVTKALDADAGGGS